jgi:hypothetical protein
MNLPNSANCYKREIILLLNDLWDAMYLNTIQIIAASTVKEQDQRILFFFI